MESKLGNSDSVEFPKRKKAFDLSEGSEGVNVSGGNRERLNEAEDDTIGGEIRKRKKVGSKKAADINTVENSGRKSGRSLNEVYSEGIRIYLESDDMVKAQLGVNQKLNSTRSNGSVKKSDSISLSLEGNVAKIPKRKRGSVRCKQVEFDKTRQSPSENVVTGPSQAVCQTAGLARDICTGEDKKTVLDSEEEPLKTTLEKKLEHLKENSIRRSKKANVLQFSKLETPDSIEGTPDLTLEHKQKKKRRKKNNDSLLSLDTGKKSSLPVRILIDNSCRLLEDEEETLEENAARMLSSRFNPDLTGFSSDRKDSSNDYSVERTTKTGFNIHSQSAKENSDSALDDNGKVLRPRKELKAKSLSRKRRHFYEVVWEDLDPCLVLKKRIKIFWPLDKSWYIGLVKDYDPEKKRHNVKYEDREEEWIDLRVERFKLLLFPSEIPYKALKTRSMVRNFHSKPEKGIAKMIKSSDMGNFKDSEPIISWLSRTNKKLKAASSGHMKNPESGLNSLKESQSGSEGVRCQEKGENNLSLSNIHGVQGMANVESTCLRVVNFPAVYSRRRFRHYRRSFNLEDELAFQFVSDRTPYFARLSENPLKRGEIDAFMGHSHHENVNPLYVADLNELFGQLATTNLSYLKFNINLPRYLVMEYASLVDNISLLHSVLLQYGGISCLWPEVQLEILFIDNSAGIKLFVFEKYLIWAVAIIFQILSTFRHCSDSGKYNDLQTPVTSVRVQISSLHLKKKISYTFFIFSHLRDMEWSYLDFKLKRQCSVMKQLGLPECTYDNIDELQLFNQMSGNASTKKRNLVENEGKCKDHSLFGVSSSTFLEQHLESLIGPRFAYGNSVAGDMFPSLECFDTSSRCIVNYNSEPCYGNAEIDSNNGAKTMADHNVSGRDCSGPTVAIKIAGVNNKKKPKDHSRKDTSNGSQFTTLSRLPVQKTVQINERSRQQISFNQSGSELLSMKSPLLDIKSQRQLRVSRRGPVITSSCDTIKNGVEKAPLVDLAGQLKQGVISRKNPTGPRSMGRRTKNLSPSLGYFTRACHHGQTEFDRNGCKNGTKMLRTVTQASNSLPDLDAGCNYKHRNPHLLENPYKKVKKPQDNKTVDSPRSPRKNLDAVSCAGNILIILEDRCWRESEAQVFLQPADHNEWVLSVKLGGKEKYSYKAYQLLQSGATNRFTYAMMWKGGKDWTFEFPDRSQWVLFKEMHNECYNRNLRVASVKIIPIPGVRLVDDFDDTTSEATPFSCHPNYYLQRETDVEIALNPSRVLYDMDSEDEQWLSNNQMSAKDDVTEEPLLSEEFFEKMMGMLEKAAYVRKHDQFTRQDIEEIFSVAGDAGPISLTMKIHDYWSQKRQRTGMPLLRQLQPPLWERYQKQLQEWERALGIFSYPMLSGGNKTTLPEKPPMFAFCLKPRGLEVTSRGTKQRTHKKYHGQGHYSAAMGDHYGYHGYGRRYNQYIYVDEKVTSPGSYDSKFSPGLISPSDGSMSYFSMSNGFDGDQQQKPYRIKSKKVGSLMVPIQPLTYNPQAAVMNFEPSQRKTGYPYWRHQKMMYPQPLSHLTEQLDGPDLEEFKLRDASGAAQHARVMAKLKRQKAERLHYRADLAMQKAMVALNIAKAMKESQGAASSA